MGIPKRWTAAIIRANLLSELFETLEGNHVELHPEVAESEYH
jgi:hypothetical protein